MTEDKQPEQATEEIAEEDGTSSLGLFNFAEAFWRAAHVLAKTEVEGGHADSPVRTLYYHVIELYLKSLLRQHYSVDDLKNKFGHKFSRLASEAEANGLTFDDEGPTAMSSCGRVISAQGQPRFIRWRRLNAPVTAYARMLVHSCGKRKCR